MRASSRTEDIASCLSPSLGEGGRRERKGSVRGEGGGERGQSRAEERITGSFTIEM